MLAAREAHTPATSALIAAGTSLSARDDDGDTTLHKAAAPGYTVIAMLAAPAAPVNTEEHSTDLFSRGSG